MPQSNSPEAQLYDHTHKLLRAHEVMLRDEVRNRAFYQALQKCVKSASIVLDIGAGVGIWAIAAAKLGAKKVVAVEMDEMLIGLTKVLAKEQGVAERVETVCGSSFDIQLEKEFDIVVSETIGYLGYDEYIVQAMADAQERFLKTGGLLIPETISLFAAAAHLKTGQETVPNGLPFDFNRLAKLNLNSPYLLSSECDLKILSKPQCLIKTNLYQTDKQPSLENLPAKWNDVPNSDFINCFVVWAECRLTENITLSTRETSSWLPTIYRIEPVKGDFPEIEFELSLTKETNHWKATFSNLHNRKIQRYSPKIAASELTLYSRTDDLNLIELLQTS